MAIVQNLISLDELFHNTKGEKLFLNQIDIFNDEQREIIDTIIAKNYTEDNISLIPSCSCVVNPLKGTYYIGETCPTCNTKVSYSMEDNISYLVWCKQPEGIAPFLNPMLFNLLDKRFRIGKPAFYTIRWLMNPRYVVSKDTLKNISDVYSQLETFLKDNNLERGYNCFMNNFYFIVESLFAMKNRINTSNKNDNTILDLIMANKKAVMSEYLPFPNKILVVYETGELGTFIDKNSISTVNIIRRLSGIDVSRRTLDAKQARVADSLVELSLYYKEYSKKGIFAKTALIRQHVVSMRAHFTGRAVITSIMGPHEQDELHIPWSVASTMYREHVLSIMLNKYDMDYEDALPLLIEHQHIRHELIENIFNELLFLGSRNGKFGINVLFNRNPSLARGSIQHQRITKIKTDVTDNTIGLSQKAMRSYNADIDGDEMAITMPLTDIVLDNLHNFDSVNNVMTLSGPNEFSGNMAYCKTAVSTMANWLRILD